MSYLSHTQGFFAAPLRYFGAPAIPTAKRVIRVSVFPSTIARIARCVLKEYAITSHVRRLQCISFTLWWTAVLNYSPRDDEGGVISPDLLGTGGKISMVEMASFAMNPASQTEYTCYEVGCSAHTEIAQRGVCMQYALLHTLMLLSARARFTQLCHQHTATSQANCSEILHSYSWQLADLYEMGRETGRIWLDLYAHKYSDSAEPGPPSAIPGGPWATHAQYTTTSSRVANRSAQAQFGVFKWPRVPDAACIDPMPSFASAASH
eukprot:2842-Heterococcus_DN1.PRE.1